VSQFPIFIQNVNGQFTEELKAKHAYFETVAARLEALELRNNHSIQITAGKAMSFVATGE
jgi:hypothetical protein